MRLSQNSGLDNPLDIKSWHTWSLNASRSLMLLNFGIRRLLITISNCAQRQLACSNFKRLCRCGLIDAYGAKADLASLKELIQGSMDVDAIVATLESLYTQKIKVPEDLILSASRVRKIPGSKVTPDFFAEICKDLRAHNTSLGSLDDAVHGLTNLSNIFASLTSVAPTSLSEKPVLVALATTPAADTAHSPDIEAAATPPAQQDLTASQHPEIEESPTVKDPLSIHLLPTTESDDSQTTVDLNPDFLLGLIDKKKRTTQDIKTQFNAYVEVADSFIKTAAELEAATKQCTTLLIANDRTKDNLVENMKAFKNWSAKAASGKIDSINNLTNGCQDLYTEFDEITEKRKSVKTSLTTQMNSALDLINANCAPSQAQTPQLAAYTADNLKVTTAAELLRIPQAELANKDHVELEQLFATKVTQLKDSMFTGFATYKAEYKLMEEALTRLNSSFANFKTQDKLHTESKNRLFRKVAESFNTGKKPNFNGESALSDNCKDLAGRYEIITQQRRALRTEIQMHLHNAKLYLADRLAKTATAPISTSPAAQQKPAHAASAQPNKLLFSSAAAGLHGTTAITNPKLFASRPATSQTIGPAPTYYPMGQLPLNQQANAALYVPMPTMPAYSPSYPPALAAVGATMPRPRGPLGGQ